VCLCERAFSFLISLKKKNGEINLILSDLRLKLFIFNPDIDSLAGGAIQNYIKLFNY
jgi:hypothetical protein